MQILDEEIIFVRDGQLGKPDNPEIGSFVIAEGLQGVPSLSKIRRAQTRGC